MNEIQTKLANLVNTALPDDDGTVIDEKVINDYIEQFAALPIFADITEADKDYVRRYLHESHKIRLVRGTAIVDRKHKKWFDQIKPSLSLDYYRRFEQHLLNDKHFPKKVIKSMDAVTDDIVDLLGNPNSSLVLQRRGLVIGDVQSGKTANYSGMICKAVDAGYRVVLLLTGTSNDLRTQTQVRLDEAFLGYDTAAFARGKGMKMVGVGNYDGRLQPTAGTTMDYDFSKSAAKTLAMPLPKQGENNPILFVCKKNVSVLKSLSEWMEAFNKHGEERIDNSLLLIDDESDYASINTRTADDPTATNKIIKKILNSFRFASYVGFTATPFANIFIDPESNEAMKNEDLFPADYIYTLESPSNYIGARDIFGQNAEYAFMLKEITDGEDYYPLKHKKDADFGFISDSLKMAINTYLVANVIKDLDEGYDNYRSMMINVSRFVNTQHALRNVVKKYVEDAQDAIKLYSHLPVNEALDNDYIHELYEAFEAEYNNTDYSWDKIQEQLEESIVNHPILVFEANQGNKELNYSNYDSKIRVIVVGGLALSRGLTLEGLMVSYIYRRSMAYDTLLQMGRWFGYRDGYSDLCRIWMSEESVSWYSMISDATDELRREVKRMRERGAIPLEFGLKVREDPDVPLIVTARNKMKSAGTRQIQTSLSSVMLETQALINDKEKNENNIRVVRDFVNENAFTKVKKAVGAYDIPKDKIVKLLDSVEVAAMNIKFDPSIIASFIKKYAGNELDKWDVILPNGKAEETFDLPNGLSIRQTERSSEIVRDGKFIRPGNNRLGSPEDMRFGLSEEQIRYAIHDSNGIKIPHPSAGDYLKKEVRGRKPVLAIYATKPKIENNIEQLKLDGTPAIGFAVGIPYLCNEETKYVYYKVNKIYQEYGEMYREEEDDEQEEII